MKRTITVLLLSASSIALLAQSAGAGFALRTVNSPFGSGGFNNVDDSSTIHIITNRSDTGARIDMDGDGFFEIVALNKNGDDDLVIFEANMDNTYTKVWGIDVNAGTGSVVPHSAAVGDADGDGLLEIVHVWGSSIDAVNIYESDGTAIVDGSNPSDTPVFTRAIADPMGVTIGNLDGDGFNEIIIVTRSETSAFNILEATGDNAFAATVSADVGNDDGLSDDGGAAMVSQVTDLDGDGANEVVVAPDREARTLDAFFVFRWDGSTITEESRLAIENEAFATGKHTVLVYDLDQSGNPEIILTESSLFKVYIYESTGTNTYATDAASGSIVIDDDIFPIAAGDFDADGDFELYIAEDDDLGANPEHVIFFEHDGTVGGFAAANFGSEQTLISDMSGSGTGGSDDPRGVAYAQGSLDGDTMGDLFVITQNGDLFAIESTTNGSGLPVELMSFGVE